MLRTTASWCSATCWRTSATNGVPGERDVGSDLAKIRSTPRSTSSFGARTQGLDDRVERGAPRG
jgi:hypothetical protein